ncbi:hypothetical protein J7F03_38230 [Streptomyces sp. ISL-43]|uniref:hypothetical protein n=1 Tax=Streptomyces sp. ISL-43 TaxID=2819183 RepID=UPI001BE5E8B4|nr:hypothetical protein [Streptomyces sp. ISL-43]MBT2452773.1 hypothetical protein [Streptomyces sp. ISL-43]
MPAIHERYSEELRSEFDYLSTWLPNSPIELGDVGRLHRDRFERVTSLTELGIPYGTRERERGVDLEYSSAASIDIAEAGAAAPAMARISVTFTRRHGIVFQARACHVSEIADRAELGRRVLELSRTAEWPAGQVVVTEVVTTGPAVVLISQQQDARVDLEADLTGMAGVLPLASLSVGLNVIRSKGIGVKVIAPDGLTPLFRASGVRRRLLSGEAFGNRGTAVPPQVGGGVADSVFAELTYEDLGV